MWPGAPNHWGALPEPPPSLSQGIRRLSLSPRAHSGPAAAELRAQRAHLGRWGRQAGAPQREPPSPALCSPPPAPARPWKLLIKQHCVAVSGWLPPAGFSHSHPTEAAWAASPPTALLTQCWEWGGSRPAREGRAPAVPQVRTPPPSSPKRTRSLFLVLSFSLGTPSSAASSASTAPFSLLLVFSRSLAPGRCVCVCVLGTLIIPPLFQSLIIVSLTYLRKSASVRISV